MNKNELLEKLTDKQKLFIYYYLNSFNVYQSALKAGYGKKYALAKSYKLLNNSNIKLLLNHFRKAQQTEFYLTQQKILERHLKIAFLDMNDFINLDGTLKERIDGTLIKKQTTKTITKGTDKTTYTVIELESRKESLKFLTKYLGLNKKG